ncbi:carboxymuconolactone decarboxylase family protein [Williamsia soli]|uniref:carboxymuconolactone decarboxylase family protein n=1 Tax=Williamsia soli TaxID=364929 RepID=UPI001A9FD470|nr:hypothetical protein [Williamsia soli]
MSTSSLSPVTLDHRLRSLQPTDMEDLDHLLEVTWSTVDPVRLELCRIRLAMLMGNRDAAEYRHPRAVDAGLDEGKIASLDRWFTSAAFDDVDRAVLAFTEQFNLAVSQMQTEDIEGLRAHFSDADVMNFSAAIYVIELDMRMRMVAQGLLHPEETK